MINQVTLIGRVGKDAESYQTSSGAVYTKFSVATSKSIKDNDGNWNEKTQWHNIIAWREVAERAERLIKKGALIYVDGEIEYGEYTGQDGIKRHTTNILAHSFRLLEKRETTDQQGETRQAQPQTAKPAATQPAYNTDKADGDDLPF